MDSAIDFSGSASKALTPQGPNLTPIPNYPSDASTPDKVAKMLGGDVYAPEVAAAKQNQVLNARTMALAKPPEAPPLKPPPKPENTSPIDAWGSMAMVFAALASFKVRNHATTAMNAAAAAMKGIQQKDRDTFDQKFKEWEAENKNMIELANFQQRAYKDLIDSVSHTEELNSKTGGAESKAAEAKAKALTFAFSDPVGASALAQGWDKFVELNKIRDGNKQKLELYKDQLSTGARKASENMLIQQLVKDKGFQEAPDERAKLEYLRNNGVDAVQITERIAALDERERKESESVGGMAKAAYEGWLTAHPNATPEEKAAAQLEKYKDFKTAGQGRLYPKLDETNRRLVAQELATYREKMPALGSFAQRNDPNGWNAVLKEAEAINPDFNPTKFDTIKKARDKLSVGKDADAVASYVRLNQHLSLFEDAVKKLPNDLSPVDAGNWITSFFNKQSGDPAVTSYDAMLEIVGDEIVKAASGTGTAAALGDRDGIKAQFSHNLSKEQLNRNIDSVKGLVGGAIVSTIGKYRSTLAPDEIREITGLSPETLRGYHVDPNTLTNTTEGPYTFGGKTVRVTKDGTGVTPETGAAQPAPAAPAASDGPPPPPGATNVQTGPEGVTTAMKDGKWIVFSPAKGAWLDHDTMQPVK